MEVEEIAEKLAGDRLRELQESKRSKVILGVSRTERLGEYAAFHVLAKARTEDISDAWLEQAERHLTAAVELFGEDRELTSIRVGEIRKYVEHLLRPSNGRGGRLAAGTARQY